MSLPPNGTDVKTPSRFKVANTSDPSSFISYLSFTDELSLYAQREYLDKKASTLKFDNWLSLHTIPDKIVQTLKKLSVDISRCGLQCAIRCAIEISIPQIWANPQVKEFISLDSKFYSMPQIGESRELFVGQFLRSSFRIDLGGSRYNIQCGEALKTNLDGLAKAISMPLTDVASWCILLALLRADTNIPETYRSEWSMKQNEIDGLLAMKVRGAYSMIAMLPGGEDLVLTGPKGTEIVQ